MFDNFKAFMQGWKVKGAFPNLPPDLPRPYTDAVISYFEDFDRRIALRMHVCESDEETLPFEFSYDALSFSMASAMAHVKNDGDEATHRFVNQALSAITVYLGKGKPEYAIGRILKDEEEIVKLHQIYRLAGAVCSISTFIRTPFPYGNLLDTVYPVRSVAIMRVLLAEDTGSGTAKEKVVAFACQIAQQFIAHSTSNPTVEKTALIAQHVADFFFALADIPPYRKKA
jgi:hypothetical protein